MIGQPTDIPGVLRRARLIISTVGLYKDDLIFDPFNRRSTTTLDAQRPMSLDSAIRCAATGDPRKSSPLADAAMRFAAARLTVDGDVCVRLQDDHRVMWHLHDWGARTTASTRSVVRVLGRLAEFAEARVEAVAA